ncbi:MAG: polyketide synthase dehydratase domain-containing protein, partial [bacterium]
METHLSSMQIRTEASRKRVNYSALVRLGAKAEDRHFDPASVGALEPFPLAVPEAYKQWLFQGPCFAGITSIEGISKDAIVGMLHTVAPGLCLPSIPAGSRWLIDPTVLDSALQLAILWERHWYDMTPLPVQIGRLHIFKSLSLQPVRCVLKAVATDAGESLTTDMYFLDTESRLLAVLEQVEFACSKSLNRLCDPEAGQSHAVHDGEQLQGVTQ